MHECSFYKTISSKEKTLQCTACRQACVLSDGSYGICGARKNIGGKLFLLTHSRPCSIHLDPIEKKPLFHYRPGSEVMSIGFFGCNFKCDFCQNYDLSCTKGPTLENAIKRAQEVSPQKFIELAKNSSAKSIAFTYNEPAISAEYNLEAIKIAKKLKGKSSWGAVYVSNGYESKEQIEALAKASTKLDAINIDLKSFNEEFYRTVCGSSLENVLKCIKDFHRARVWIELTTLIIPGKNNSPEELKQIARFIASIDESIPWHVTAFRPLHRMTSSRATNATDIGAAVKIGKKEGLRFVYGGNLGLPDLENTFCPKCGTTLIARGFFNTQIVNLEVEKSKGKSKGVCSKCGEKIEGVFE